MKVYLQSRGFLNKSSKSLSYFSLLFQLSGVASLLFNIEFYCSFALDSIYQVRTVQQCMKLTEYLIILVNIAFETQFICVTL